MIFISEITPMIFVGHGSPLNALGENEFNSNWSKLSKFISVKPKAILIISAHWTEDKNFVSFNPTPKIKHDFKGFPKELYEIFFMMEGDTGLSNKVYELLDGNVTYAPLKDFDHGIWMPLMYLYPENDIPVVSLSVNRTLSPTDIFRIGRKLKPLREEGVLLVGSGNIVHNKDFISRKTENGYDWADAFDDYIKKKILKKQFEDVVHFERSGEIYKKAFLTSEHFAPLLYLLGAFDNTDEIRYFNNKRIMGGLSMTSYLFGKK